MIKNGKIFVPPTSDDSNFKEKFKRLAAAGAGRAVDDDGFPAGPWTPDLLAEAISQIEANPSGIELRTVQLWFQDNEKGVSTDNIRWLARIFGCGDPDATSGWQMELSAAQSRLTAKRRALRKSSAIPERRDQGVVRNAEAGGSRSDFSLARMSEAIFSRQSPLDLAASVFAGSVALGLLSYFVNIHSVIYIAADGVSKQVGYLWALNWMFVFTLFMPLYLAFLTELLVYWKHDGRAKQLTEGNRIESQDGWMRSVEASSYTYWAVLLVCLLVVGLFQWIDRRLMPLMEGDLGSQPVDWGVIAIVDPEIILVPQSIAFTGFSYLYMSVCFYVFFAGLILLFTIAHDFWRISKRCRFGAHRGHQQAAHQAGLTVMSGIFRCTILGLFIAIVMKLQSAFLISNGETILKWLVRDLYSVFYAREAVGNESGYSTPTHYSSLVIVLATCFVFLYGFVRINAIWNHHNEKGESQRRVLFWKMPAVVAFLVAGYLLIDVFAGFSILLGVGVLFALHGLIDPELGRARSSETRSSENVS